MPHIHRYHLLFEKEELNRYINEWRQTHTYTHTNTHKKTLTRIGLNIFFCCCGLHFARLSVGLYRERKSVEHGR